MKRKLAPAAFIFILALGIYMGTLVSDYEVMSSYLGVASSVEGSGEENDIAHPLWVPLGRLVYTAAHAAGFSWSGLFVMKLISALAGAASCSLFYLLLLGLLEDWILAWIVSVLASFSYIQWFVATCEKNYSLSGLFLVPAFYFLLKAARGDFKSVPILGLLHALAVTAHISNILFFAPAFTVLFFGAGSVRGKIKSILVYSAIFFVGALLLMDFFLFLSPFRNFVASSGFMVKALQQMTHSISSGQYQTLSPGFYLLRIFNWILLSTPAFRFFQFSGWVLLACAVSALAVLWINRKTSGHLFLPLAGAAVWLGIYIANMIRVAMPNLFDNLNIYVILFPFWILMGTFLSTPGRIPAGKTLSICSRALIRVLLLALLVYSFISNLTTYFLPRHAGYSDSVGAVARFYERELRSDDLVITTRNYADFFAYFVKCRTVNIVFPSSFVSSNRGRAEYIMQLADEYMGAGRRVIWHHVAAVYGTQTQEIWNRRVDVSEDDYKKISAFLEKEIRKKWLLVPGKQYSTENGLFILERPSR